MNTLHCTELRTSSPRIWNYADSDGETGTGGNFRPSLAAPRQIHTAQGITQEKLHDRCNVPRDWFHMYFRLWHGSATLGIKQLVIHITLYLSTCNPQTTRCGGVDLCHKNVRHPWFTETRVIRYYTFVSAHNAPFHSECNTNDKSSNKTCENNITPPTNIQYLKIHVRN